MIVTDINVLRQKSELVGEKEDISKILEDMREELLNSKTGIGLAAIQIGILKRIFCIKVPAYDSNHNLIKGKYDIQFFVNPEILEQYDSIVCRNEGCLSLPGQYVDTNRFRYVEMKYRGREPGVVFKDLMAQVVEHECDHLDGILIFDRKFVSKPIVKADKVGRNDPCPCGSGKKYKKCCGVTR